MTFFRKAWIIARKDILTELRSREMLSTMGAFAALIILLFAFAFDLRTGSTGTAARASTVTPARCGSSSLLPACWVWVVR
jgi:ABC-type transport system involved in cytochrome c biogenesis permease component